MNTIDAKPQTSLGDSVTLVRRSYPEVNALIRTNPNCQKTFVDIIYGKQNLIDADPPLPAAKRRPRSAVSGASGDRTTNRRRRNISEPLVRPDDAADTGPGFDKAFVDDRQQRSRRERLAQAARGAEFERHAQEVRRRRVEVGKGVSRHRNQRNRRRAFVEYPDRFETAHARHEDVDQHQVEAAVFQRTKPGFAAIGYRHVKAVTLEIDLDGRTDLGIVIDDENACHVSPPEADNVPSIILRSQPSRGRLVWWEAPVASATTSGSMKAANAAWPLP